MLPGPWPRKGSENAAGMATLQRKRRPSATLHGDRAAEASTRIRMGTAANAQTRSDFRLALAITNARAKKSETGPAQERVHAIAATCTPVMQRNPHFLVAFHLPAVM